MTKTIHFAVMVLALASVAAAQDKLKPAPVAPAPSSTVPEMTEGEKAARDLMTQRYGEFERQKAAIQQEENKIAAEMAQFSAALSREHPGFQLSPDAQSIVPIQQPAAAAPAPEPAKKQ